jgi:CDP-diacylglycerol--glycerol-3-phosphate 3-phosphatidyltransferase
MATLTRSRPPVFNLPNQLTASRFVLALILFGLIAYEYWLSCLAVFALASLTDYLDGYFARKQGISSSLGRNLDPLVDKVLVCGAFIFLIPYGMASGTEDRWLMPWMVTVIVARELIITSLRSYMENAGGNFGADWLGKIKMGLQCAALIAIFVFLYARANDPYNGTALWVFARLRDGFIWATLASTALSGFQYLWRAYQIYQRDKNS